MIYNSNFSLNNMVLKKYVFIFLLYPKRNQYILEKQEVICFQARADT